MRVSGPSQLWIADLTYIRLKTQFVYLAVMLDVFSRKVTAWAVGRTLQAKLSLHALEQAIANRQPPPGVVHHSDQGVQYACRQYMQKLHGMGEWLEAIPQFRGSHRGWRVPLLRSGNGWARRNHTRLERYQAYRFEGNSTHSYPGRPKGSRLP